MTEPRNMKEISAKSIEDLIGYTPIIQLYENFDNKGSNIFGKLEYFNPSLSIKDRTALGLILDAENKGIISKGDTIVESTSGNLGQSLAMICASRGYRLICIVDPKTPTINISIFKAFGAEVVFVDSPDEKGSYQENRINMAKKISLKNRNTVNLDQYSNESAIDYHDITTGVEIYRQTNKKLNWIVAAASTGGHVSGIARFLKSQNESIGVVATEPEGSVIFGKSEYHTFKTNGAGLSFKPKNYKNEYIDIERKFTDDDAFEKCRELSINRGIFLGASSGGVVSVAENLCRENSISGNIVCILPDYGLKYIDSVYSHN